MGTPTVDRLVRILALHRPHRTNRAVRTAALPLDMLLKAEPTTLLANSSMGNSNLEGTAQRLVSMDHKLSMDSRSNSTEGLAQYPVNMVPRTNTDSNNSGSNNMVNSSLVDQVPHPVNTAHSLNMASSSSSSSSKRTDSKETNTAALLPTAAEHPQTSTHPLHQANLQPSTKRPRTANKAINTARLAQHMELEHHQPSTRLHQDRLQASNMGSKATEGSRNRGSSRMARTMLSRDIRAGVMGGSSSSSSSSIRPTRRRISRVVRVLMGRRVMVKRLRILGGEDGVIEWVEFRAWGVRTGENSGLFRGLHSGCL